jgi:hypothetical protein
MKYFKLKLIRPSDSLSMCQLFLSLSLYGCTALWTLAAFEFLNPTYSQQNSLHGGSAHRKAATYTQNKRTQTSMP